MMADDPYSAYFTRPEEIIERLSKERKQPVQVRYDGSKNMWCFMVPNPAGVWCFVAGTEDRTMLGCLTRAWQMWLNKVRLQRPQPGHN